MISNTKKQIICDRGCKKSFALKHLKVHKYADGVWEPYFQCPYCKTKYIIYYSNIHIRYLQDLLAKSPVNSTEYRKLQSKLRTEIERLLTEKVGEQNETTHL